MNPFTNNAIRFLLVCVRLYTTTYKLYSFAAIYCVSRVVFFFSFVDVLNFARLIYFMRMYFPLWIEYRYILAKVNDVLQCLGCLNLALGKISTREATSRMERLNIFE